MTQWKTIGKKTKVGRTKKPSALEIPAMARCKLYDVNPHDPCL